MREALRALLWVGVAAGVAVALVGGYALFQLSNLYPDEATGEQVAAEVEDALAAHPALTPAVTADRASGEVSVRLTAARGELAEADVLGALRSLGEVMGEHEGSGWSVTSTIEGEWAGTPVRISGWDTGRWPELSPILDLPGGHRTQLSLDLAARAGGITRDLDTERLCGTGVAPREFFGNSLSEASDAATELGWTGPDDPGFSFAGSGCQDPRRVSVHLTGDDRSEVLADLQEIVATLPDTYVLTSLHADANGDLRLDTRTPVGRQRVPESLERWPHGEVRVNGELLSSR
ncbi:hypothetical protein [Ornithinimicrobium cavernae]|uniref:hypothetical protein n=1 Tax=Ornithinimicrobium cavernae TaxID=2666047 RepID=UPI000D692EB7|nr:hypothetical protein [Ornithinimicrobium cavernae]